MPISWQVIMQPSLSIKGYSDMLQSSNRINILQFPILSWGANMDSSSESVVSSLGSFAEMLSDPEGYDPERLKSLSVGVPSSLSSFIEAMLSSDEEVMKRRLTDLEDYASVVNSVQAWFNLGRLAHHLFFHQAAIEYYSNASDLAQILSDDDSLASILLCLGALYGEEEDWARACQCY